MTASTPDRSLMDEFLPNHDFSAAYEIYQRASFGGVRVSAALGLQRTVAAAPADEHQKWKMDAAQPRVHRSASAAPRYGLHDFGRSSERRNRYRHCGALLASRWRAVQGTYCEGLCRVLSLRLREGSVEFQAAGRVASEYSSFDGDENQVLWFGGVLEVSPLLDCGGPVLWTHAKGDSQTSEDRGGITS